MSECQFWHELWFARGQGAGQVGAQAIDASSYFLTDSIHSRPAQPATLSAINLA
jgi:hypothetical protein